MPFNRITWQNKPATATPLSAANLNRIESGIASVTDRADLRFKGLPTLAALGDSLVATNSELGEEPRVWRESWIDIGNFYADSMFDFLGASAFGGITIEQAETSYLPDVIELEPDYCVVLIGQNSLEGGISVAERSSLLRIYNGLVQTGIIPILVTNPPTTVGEVVREFNQFVREFAENNGLPLFDMYAVLVDWQTGLYRAGESSDGTHPNAVGVSRIARAFGEWVLATFTHTGASTHLVRSVADGRPHGGAGLMVDHADGLPTYFASITAGIPSVALAPNGVGNAFTAEKTSSEVRYQVNTAGLNVQAETEYRVIFKLSTDVETTGGSWAIEFLDVANGYAMLGSIENLPFDFEDYTVSMRVRSGVGTNQILPVIKVMGGPATFDEAGGVGATLTISQLTVEEIV